MDFLCPVVYQVKVFLAEPASLVLRSHDEVVEALLEEPLAILVFEHDSTLLDFVEFYHVTWRVWELVLVLIRDEYSLDWIDIEVPIICFQASSVNLLYVSFDSLHGIEAHVWLFEQSVVFHLTDDVINF